MNHRRRLLDLGHQEGAITDQLTGFDNVFRALHKRQRDPVHAQLQAETQVAAVFLGQRAQLQHRFWNVDAFAVGQLATGDHFGDHRVAVLGGDLQAQAAIVEQQAHARLQCFDDFRVGQVDPINVARGAVKIQAQGLAALQVDLALGKAANAQLRPLQIHEDTDRGIQLLFDFTHPVVTLGVVGVFAVAEVEAEQVDPGLHQLADVVDGFDRGAKGGEDFYFLVGVHLAGFSRIRMARKSLTLVRVGPVTIS